MFPALAGRFFTISAIWNCISLNKLPASLLQLAALEFFSVIFADKEFWNGLSQELTGDYCLAPTSPETSSVDARNTLSSSSALIMIKVIINNVIIKNDPKHCQISPGEGNAKIISH